MTFSCFESGNQMVKCDPKDGKYSESGRRGLMRSVLTILLSGLLLALPWRRCSQRYPGCCCQHQDQAHHSVRRLVPDWLQGKLRLQLEVYLKCSRIFSSVSATRPLPPFRAVTLPRFPAAFACSPSAYKFGNKLQPILTSLKHHRHRCRVEPPRLQVRPHVLEACLRPLVRR